eukprot:TRINITY_DN6071_c0_g1_i4.p1 TRINITY_DN6071_c0_g1~~TRINITY_DN6071_c0_g1_i4.p1  ORF type:complete len:373 (+),score=77.00 TRINITY_DN6071_c0_g1_i4:47-1165(+)
MASRLLSRVGLSPLLASRLHTANIRTCKDALGCTVYEFAQKAEISVLEAQEIMTRISEEILPNPTTLLELLSNQRQGSQPYIETVCPRINETMKGGVHIGSVTEVVGPCGLGKTQFCFALGVVTTLPVILGGRDAGVIYIDTEGSFSAERILEITRSNLERMGGLDVHEAHAICELTLDRFSVHSCPSIQELGQRLDSLEEEIIQQNAKLIVIDSLASPTRKDFDSKSGIQRQEFLARYASLLKQLAETYKVAVVVTNQVTTRKTGHSVKFSFEGRSSLEDEDAPDAQSLYLTAALGSAWAYFANTRIILEEDEGKRYFKIAKSPIAPVCRLPYHVTACGAVGLSSAVVVGGNYCENMRILRGDHNAVNRLS